MADLLVPERAQPSRLRRGILRDPGTDGLDHEDVGEARDDGLAPGPQLPGFGRHDSQCALDPVHLGRSPRVDDDQAGQELDEAVRGRVVEADRPAEHASGGAASAPCRRIS